MGFVASFMGSFPTAGTARIPIPGGASAWGLRRVAGCRVWGVGFRVQLTAHAGPKLSVQVLQLQSS